jgi:hypothetical protein
MALAPTIVRVGTTDTSASTDNAEADASAVFPDLQANQNTQYFQSGYQSKLEETNYRCTDKNMQQLH